MSEPSREYLEGRCKRLEKAILWLIEEAAAPAERKAFSSLRLSQALGAAIAVMAEDKPHA